jgi:hypothetical protein
MSFADRVVEFLQLNEFIVAASAEEKDKARQRGKGEIHFVVKSHKGKILGYCKTKKEAQKRLRAVEYFKRA